MNQAQQTQIEAFKMYNKLSLKDIKPRDYQTKIAYEAWYKLTAYGICYLSMQMRTGKTLTSLMAASLLCRNNEHVLFVTKKKAIASIQNDLKQVNNLNNVEIINYESLHKVSKKDYYLIIIDEAHSCFLGNTLINGTKIKDIKVGSFQNSFNFAKGIYEKKKVLNVFKKPLNENLVKIKCNGKEIVCTENHKIFTKRGWIKAKEILSSDELQVV